MIKALALIGDFNGCTHWRVERPFVRLDEQGAYAAMADKDEPGVENVAHLFDAIVLPRMAWHNHEDGARFIGALHRAGLCVVYECDDDLFSEHINYRIQATVEKSATIEELEAKRVDRLAAIRLCDGVTVSSPRLATVMREMVDCPVLVVPNAIDIPWWRDALRAEPERTDRRVTIGWAGGSRPDDDIGPMAEAWGRVAQAYPDVRFAVYGYQPEPFRSAVPADRLVMYRWRPVESYPGPFRQIDIGCAAVTDTPFNRAKTPIKSWEYAMGGAAVVATPTLYGHCVTDQRTGLVAETADEWTAALSELIENAPRRKRLARNLLRHVEREHALSANLWRWPTAWAAIRDQFLARRGSGAIARA